MGGAGWQETVFAAAGWVLLALGVALLVWSLLWDRPRGRQRCPKCWYDMSGATSLVCPECGRDARRSRRLLKTRRSWRWACLALLLLVAAYPVGVTPDIRRDGFWAGAPRWFVIVSMPYLPDDADVLAVCFPRLFLPDRHLADLWTWERWLLDKASVRALEGGRVAYQLGTLSQLGLHDDAIQRVDARHRSNMVVLAAGCSYLRCQTYRDRGRTYSLDGHADFVTHVSRGNGFCFKVRRTGSARGPNLAALWGNGPDYNCWIEGSPAGTSSLEVAASTIASKMFMGPEVAPVSVCGQLLWLIRNESFEWRGSERFDGVDCYIIRGKDVLGATVDIGFDERTYLIRFVRRGGQLPVFTVVRPEVDVQIDPACVTFDPANFIDADFPIDNFESTESTP